MGKSGEFYTFDEVIKYLAIPETKLKRLVSEGEIRAFREGDEMKFRKTDVENMDLTGARSEEETGVIDLSAGRDDSSETLTDDLIFDEGDDLDLTDAGIGLATAEISSQDTLVDEEGIGMSTEPLGIDADLAEVVDEDEMEDSRPSRGGGPPRAPARPAGPPPEPKDAGWAAIMLVTTLVMIGGLIVTMGIRDSALAANMVPDTAKSLADIFYK